MAKADTRLILWTLSRGKQACPHYLKQEEPRGRPPPRLYPLLVPVLLGDQDHLLTGGHHDVGVRRGYTTQTSMRAPLFRHICVASRPRCRRRRDRFPGWHLTSLWPRLLSRHFLPCSHHSYSHNPQRNHHLQVVTRNLKHLWEIAPPTPINYRIVIYPYRTRFFVTSWDNCSPFHTPLLFAGSDKHTC